MQLSAFVAVGSYLGEDLVGQPLTDSLNEIERNEYLQGLSQGDKSAESYAKELVRQFISNNVTGRYTHPAYSVGDSIYDLMNKKASDEFDGKTLNGIVGQITDYKGFSVALDEPLAVPCRYVCMLRSNRRELPSNQREQIEAIDENRYRI